MLYWAVLTGLVGTNKGMILMFAAWLKLQKCSLKFAAFELLDRQFEYLSRYICVRFVLSLVIFNLQCRGVLCVFFSVKADHCFIYSALIFPQHKILTSQQNSAFLPHHHLRF